MKKKVSVINLNGDNNIPLNLSPLLELPSKCPICETGYANLPLVSYFIQSDSTCLEATIYSLHLCPHCEKCFMVTYSAYGSYNYLESEISEILPYSESCTKFSLKISNLSPKFVEIYSQAEKAEYSGLSEICGLGYRKALEFLVKDYAIRFHPDNEDQIKNSMLAQCITNFIDNPRIKSLAKASAWIGNDETHYVRKHEDYNLSHLKAFIQATVSYVDSELAYLEAESLLTNPR